MFEKVNPAHPDKIADRIAGAIVDLAYTEDANPKVAVEVLIGHGICYIVAETSVHIPVTEIIDAVENLVDEADFSVADDRAVVDVALADKVGNESVRRFVVDILRSADLLDFAVFHNDDPVTHREGFFLVVRDKYKSYSRLTIYSDKFISHRTT